MAIKPFKADGAQDWTEVPPSSWDTIAFDLNLCITEEGNT